ncbi:MAG TPA: phospholipase D-like domain-containing protein [Tepidisphaeraceae bacterium]|jgi:hypothetical protein|nr:phospholipase D-like domain-containing protein [Tepidisphaeraceae bacterium]
MGGLLPSPWAHDFEQLVESAEQSLVLCAPFVGAGPCRVIANRIEKLGRSDSVEVHILTDLCRDNLLSGVTDVASLMRLAEALPRTTIRFLPSLHAKIYVADERRAIVTSSNLTDNGMLRNFEYGVRFDERDQVIAVRNDVLRYSALASSINRAQLQQFVQITQDLRELARAAQRSIKRTLHEEFERRLAAADIEILRARTGGRTAHGIFAAAILHLLRDGPMRTVDLNRSIQRIHPDLCDDAVDRVIDGQHFGKKWKHGVRTAQVFLRRAGRIERVAGSWRLAPKG